MWLTLNERTERGKRAVIVNMDHYARIEPDGTGALIVSIDEKRSVAVVESVQTIAKKMQDPFLQLRCD